MRLFRLTSVLAGVLVAGCYTLQPVTGAAPEVGMKVALDINDVGRVALGGTIGPEIGQLEGTLIDQPNGEYVLAVSQVRYLRGGFQNWTGERVSVKKDYVGRTYERRFHKGRTYLLGATIIGGIVAVAAAQDLLGFGISDGDPVPPDTGISFRGRRRP